jgi:preprotein translocase subunit SecE
VARDRQRAKQRRRARSETPNPGPAPSKLARENVSGELEHASGEVDEFEAALITGSGDPDADAQAAFGDNDDAALEREAVQSGPGEESPARRSPVPAEPTKRGPARFAAFLRACWSELQRVQWPDRQQVTQATAVVIGFVIVAGLYLGVADYVAKQIVNAII